jgi:hydrogenase nickel incorporation protein HypA/HybF
VHELSIVTGLFDTLLEKAGEHGAREITLVKLRVGKLSGVVPELLESAFDMYKKGTIAEKARLVIEEIPLRIRCRSCRAEARKDEFAFVCSSCRSTDIEILEGTEIFLEKIELEID